MPDYEFICDQCECSVLTTSFEDDGQECQAICGYHPDCQGHLRRQFKYGIGSVSGAGYSPGRAS